MRSSVGGRRRVVITGIGVVSPIGHTFTQFGKRLFDGLTGIKPITRFNASRFASQFAGEIDDADIVIADRPFAHETKRMGLFVRYALAAANDALTTSGIQVKGQGLPGGGLFIGVAMGGLPNIEAGVIWQETKGPQKISPFLIPSLIPNMAASMIALSHQIVEPQYTIAGACASGSQALGQAMRAIQAREYIWALAGGSEAVTTPITFSGFEAMRVLSTAVNLQRTPRPFDQQRDGMIVGEGAGIFVLEELSHAKARGATIYGELTGYATTSSISHPVLQSVNDITHCMKLSLVDAHLQASEIDGIYAQASGLIKGDASEMSALQTIFATRAKPPVITSIKGHIGHSFAASGPLNLVAALSALRHQKISPTLNFETTEPLFTDLDIVREPRTAPIRHCLINTFGFGGINASLIVSQYQQ